MNCKLLSTKLRSILVSNIKAKISILIMILLGSLLSGCIITPDDRLTYEEYPSPRYYRSYPRDRLTFEVSPSYRAYPDEDVTIDLTPRKKRREMRIESGSSSSSAIDAE